MKRHHYLPKAGVCILISMIILNIFTIGSGAELNRSEWNRTQTTVTQAIPTADAGVTNPEVNTEKSISQTVVSQTYEIQSTDDSTDKVIKSDNNLSTTSEFSEKDTQFENKTEYEAEDQVYVPAPVELYPGCISYELPEYKDYHGFKCYESYTALSSNCAQGYLQQLAETDEMGFRKIKGRYLVAIGTYFNAPVGTWFDLILENGTRIYCIVGDIKADEDTDANNIFTVHSRCCSEFLVSMNDLDETIKVTGNCSHRCSEWNSPVVQLIVYDINELE